MLKIAIWQTDVGKTASDVLEQIYSRGAIQAYVQLTSFFCGKEVLTA
jgi:hypothetical protein